MGKPLRILSLYKYIMGHSNVAMTLDYYAHATATSTKAEMDGLVA
jgi:hypothetical protein